MSSVGNVPRSKCSPMPGRTRASTNSRTRSRTASSSDVKCRARSKKSGMARSEGSADERSCAREVGADPQFHACRHVHLLADSLARVEEGEIHLVRSSREKEDDWTTSRTSTVDVDLYAWWIADERQRSLSR